MSFVEPVCFFLNRVTKLMNLHGKFVIDISAKPGPMFQ